MTFEQIPQLTPLQVWQARHRAEVLEPTLSVGVWPGTFRLANDGRLVKVVEEEEECPHYEQDHGICLECEEDVTQSLVMRAESMRDAREDR